MPFALLLSEVKDDLSRYLREAEEEPVVITRHGKPAGVGARAPTGAGDPRANADAPAPAAEVLGSYLCEPARALTITP
jgi:hypothetical protein